MWSDQTREAGEMKKVIKAWAVINNRGTIIQNESLIINRLKSDADFYAKDFGAYDDKAYLVVPCFITYTPPKRARKKP